MDENSIEYKVEKVYISLFFNKKFKKMVYDCDYKAVEGVLRFTTTNGGLGVGIGWDEKNNTIVDISKRGIWFNNDETEMFSFKTITKLLIKKYGKYQQISLFSN